MADLPFGFSPGDDPDRAKPGGEVPGFNIADLGKLFTQLGAMFSGAGGPGGGPVNYDLARSGSSPGEKPKGRSAMTSTVPSLPWSA